MDPQGDRWEWQPIEMTACTIQVRETIHAPGGPLATEYTVPLADVASIHSLDGWVSLRTHRPTIVSRTLLRVGDPSVEPGDLFQLKFSDAALVRRVQRAMLHAAVLCRRNAPGKEPF